MYNTLEKIIVSATTLERMVRVGSTEKLTDLKIKIKKIIFSNR